jgi:hypothetical protein
MDDPKKPLISGPLSGRRLATTAGGGVARAGLGSLRNLFPDYRQELRLYRESWILVLSSSWT